MNNQGKCFIKTKLRHIVYSLILAIFLLIVTGCSLKNKQKNSMEVSISSSSSIRSKENESVSQSSSQTQSEKSSEPSVDMESSMNEENHQKALNTLESLDQPVSDSLKADVTTALIAAQNYVRGVNHPDELKGDQYNHMLMSSPGMIQTYWIVIKFGNYAVDPGAIEVFETKHADVVQFVCKLTSDGKENSYFVGNYNTYAKQLQFGSYHGGQVDATFG